MTDLKVTDGIHTRALIQYDAIAAPGVNTRALREALEAALAHPDFRAQVAQLMRGMVPGRDSDGGSYALAHNHCREDVFARIQQWEEGA